MTLTGLTPGNELIVWLSNPLGDTWYSGPGYRNSDGDIHADITTDGPGNYDVNFEDEPASFSDFNYADGQILVTGNVSVTTSPSPMAVVPFGLGLVGAIRRRFRK